MRIDVNDITENGKIMQLMHDFVIMEDRCNLNCDYCMTRNSYFSKERRTSRHVIAWSDNNSTGHELDYNMLPMSKQIDDTLNSYLNYFTSPILKISGGEILLIKNIAKLIIKESMRYETVQILTNGICINANLLDELDGLSNIHFQVSIDGHTSTMNYLRMKSNELHNRLLANVDLLINRKFPVELYCVLTKQNMKEMPSFLDYLVDKYESKVCLILFPVRHTSGEAFLPEKPAVKSFDNILNNYEKYRGILPSDKYISVIYDYLLNRRRRQLRCFVPFIMLQSFDDGSVTPCPYNWVLEIGNLNTDPRSILGMYGTSNTYHMRTNEPPWAPFCRKCYTDSVIFSLFFNGIIGLDELGQNRPFLQKKDARRRLMQLKTVFHSKLSSD